jgi:hypothetical protein
VEHLWAELLTIISDAQRYSEFAPRRTDKVSNIPSCARFSLDLYRPVGHSSISQLDESGRLSHARRCRASRLGGKQFPNSDAEKAWNDWRKAWIDLHSPKAGAAEPSGATAKTS